ncbi:HU family DNA-binding protein [Tannerella forsythia]|uniref:HU family DNA-binding protein n=1 Tax=Tannerella forsythia TaxID=28112 RepID=A0A3P1YWF5_TANFO|nr:HU family DNA-binding protein [Tannerella forsythia]RRD60570.1 HU family DNA-binding protein [Tannerella forsythia]RRD73173.1 HU family DNA-binding protein [Tannerella forsythia]
MKDIELITELSNRLRWEKHEVEEMLDAFSRVIGDKLAGNDIISLHGLGQFEAKKKDERFLANPSNSKRYLIPPKLVPVFKPVATLKAYLKTLDNHG